MSVPASRITQESDPNMWQLLYQQWVRDRKPGTVVLRAGGEQYNVIQIAGTEKIAFDPVTNEAFYESTSF